MDIEQQPGILTLGAELFWRFVQESPDAIAVSRLADGRLVEVNQAFLDLVGFRREDALGRTTLEIGLWADPAERKAMLDQLRNGTAATGVAFQLHTSRGVRHIEASVQLLELDGDTYVFAIDRDVTRRKLAEEQGRETEEMLRATIESTADGILVVDEHGRTAYANARFARMWRIPVELIEAGSDDDMLAFVLNQLQDPEAFISKVRELYERADESFDTLLFKDGRVFERYSRPLTDKGRVAGRVWSFRDVTARQTGEDALREAETKYRTLVEQIPAITYVDAAVGPETTLYISPQTEAMLGYTPEDWLSEPHLLSKIVHPDDEGTWRQAMSRCDETGEPLHVQYRIRARDGHVVWVQDEAVLMRDREGRPQFWQGVMLDITERKRAEEHLEQAWQKELEAAQRLRALDDMKNTFLEAVSHELRTPLTAILGSALTLERQDLDLDPEETRDLARRLGANARKLNRLLSDLLDLDRLARGIVEPKRQPTDVDGLLRRVVEESELLAGHTVEVQAEPVMIRVDPAKVERIMENLIANTARHTPPGTSVWIRVSPHQGGALIEVADGGPGIPPELRELVFQPFQQLPGAPSHAPGVGIGLSLVAKFAELHGGRAWVEERPGGGASFRVFLPDGAPEGSPAVQPGGSGSVLSDAAG